jgi:hypothetical protein
VNGGRLGAVARGNGRSAGRVFAGLGRGGGLLMLRRRRAAAGCGAPQGAGIAARRPARPAHAGEQVLELLHVLLVVRVARQPQRGSRGLGRRGRSGGGARPAHANGPRLLATGGRPRRR